MKVSNSCCRTAHLLRCPYQRQNACFWHFVCIPRRVHSNPSFIYGGAVKVSNPRCRTAHLLRCPYQRQNACFLAFCVHPPEAHSNPFFIYGGAAKTRHEGLLCFPSYTSFYAYRLYSFTSNLYPIPQIVRISSPFSPILLRSFFTCVSMVLASPK